MSPPLQEKKISAVYIADHVLDQNFTACDGFFLIRLWSHMRSKNVKFAEAVPTQYLVDIIRLGRGHGYRQFWDLEVMSHSTAIAQSIANWQRTSIHTSLVLIAGVTSWFDGFRTSSTCLEPRLTVIADSHHLQNDIMPFWSQQYTGYDQCLAQYIHTTQAPRFSSDLFGRLIHAGRNSYMQIRTRWYVHWYNNSDERRALNRLVKHDGISCFLQ